jgi:hypothetical protein
MLLKNRKRLGLKNNCINKELFIMINMQVLALELQMGKRISQVMGKDFLLEVGWLSMTLELVHNI